MTDNLNSKLCNILASEIAKRGNKVAYISSEPQDSDRLYYKSTIVDYSVISSDIQVDYFDLSENFSDDVLAGLLDYGTIYLSGGNTYSFMDSARKRNINSILKKHLENGGLLIGASAGAIMMTPSIDLAGYEDENIVGLTDTKGFGFVSFEFQPHFTGEQGEMNFISKYRGRKGTKIYTCVDGSGIFYSQGEIKIFGDVLGFE